MNIGFDAKRLFLNFTGLGNYSRFIVKALYDTFPGNNYFLFTPRSSDVAETHPFFDANGFSIVTPPSSLVIKSLWRSVGLGFTKQAHQLHLYHGLSYELPLFLPSHVKKVVTIHDLIFLRFPELYKAVDRYIYKQKVINACNRADAIITISEQTAADLYNFLSIPRDRIRVVYQGCHHHFEKRLSPMEINTVRDTYGLPKEYILNVGTIEARKNLAVLVDALAQLDKPNRLPLVVVGKKTPYFAEVMKKVVKHNLQAEIIFIHDLPFHALPAVYQGSRVFVYPSFFEGFGIPILEAIRSGVPVITSKGSCFHEAGGPATHYVAPDDPVTLAQVLQEIIQNDLIRSKIIEESTEFSKRFEATVVAHDLMNLYKEIVSR
jgi:glycosyltransferase involved in cell wall biosynthesis